MGTSWRCKCPTLRPTRKNVEKKKWSQSVPVYTKNKKIPGTLYAVSIHEKDEKVRECPIRYDMNMNERRAQAATYVRKNEWSCFVSKFEITPGKDSNAPTRRLRPQKHYTSYYDGRQTWLAALIRLSAVTHGTLYSRGTLNTCSTCNSTHQAGYFWGGNRLQPTLNSLTNKPIQLWLLSSH